MSTPPSPRPRWLRIAALVLGAALFLWLPIEDNSLIGVLLFGAALSLWGSIYVLSSLAVRERLRWFHYPLAALLAGLLVGPLAALLMVFKIGVHGHEAPDFSLQQVEMVIKRAPFWGLGGLLVGLGVGVWRQWG